MKIGIGVTTYNRPKHIENWLTQIRLYCAVDVVYLADDCNDRKGIAYRKNECLRALKDCDYIFLFDDDTFPIKEGWAEFFIEAHKASGQHHFLYLKETPTIKIIDAIGSQDGFINIYNNCAGSFMFLTKEVIEKVGALNPLYGIYGYEHAGYSNRIHEAGLTPMGKYLCPTGAGEYIYAMDFDYHLPFNKQVNHEPSLKNELHLLGEYLGNNKKIYEMDNVIYLPL